MSMTLEQHQKEVRNHLNVMLRNEKVFADIIGSMLDIEDDTERSKAMMTLAIDMMEYKHKRKDIHFEVAKKIAEERGFDIPPEMF